eukprot:3642164-Rhodomonas_salina.2
MMTSNSRSAGVAPSSSLANSGTGNASIEMSAMSPCTIVAAGKRLAASSSIGSHRSRPTMFSSFALPSFVRYAIMAPVPVPTSRILLLAVTPHSSAMRSNLGDTTSSHHFSGASKTTSTTVGLLQNSWAELVINSSTASLWLSRSPSCMATPELNCCVLAGRSDLVPNWIVGFVEVGPLPLRRIGFTFEDIGAAPRNTGHDRSDCGERIPSGCTKQDAGHASTKAAGNSPLQDPLASMDFRRGQNCVFSNR